MSRIGNQPIEVPAGVTVSIAGATVVVKGPKGEQAVMMPSQITVSEDGNVLTVKRKRDGDVSALHGLARAILANAIVGVTAGWSKTLELVGVGYRATLTGVDLQLTVGYSHPVTITPPAGIVFTVAEGKVVVSGVDRHLVGQIAANIRAVKPPEPYKGKGIKYNGEYIRKKAGKAAKAIGGAPGAAGGGAK
ncbi:50S ribosomal protein L6 [Candidatus Gottesmanbacteria bacterium]|nr:50S ribosomal protein L6 [Candidatus Gottesmanbacteria bacterium]